MKQLILVGNQKVKFQDTETIISLTLVSDGNTVIIDKDKTYSIKIKNGTGYVKSINATPNTTNNMVTFSTSGLDGLPVDAYFIELWVIDSNGQTIYPSDSFIEVDITANATGVEGQVLPAITMQEFEERFSTLQSNLETKVGTLIGPTGNGINTVVTEYQLSASGSNVPTGTWSKSPATPTDTLPYMWTRNVTTYTDKSTHVSYNISAKGTKGNNFTIQGSTSSIAGLPSVGTDGEGYMVGTELYVWTNGKWNDIVNMKGVQGDKGIQGIQGVKGDTGNGISSITTEYELSKQGTAVPSTGWSSTLLTMTNDLPYLWTRVTITFTNGSKNMVYFTSNKGDKGDTGEKGDKGDTGANLAVKGAVDKDTELPSSGNTEGDAYMVGTNLYVYTSNAWKNCGPIVAENTVLYNADGSLNVNGTNYNYVQDLRNGKIQYNDGTKNIELTPVDSQKEAKDILSARNYTDASISSLSNSINTKLSGYATNSDLNNGLNTKVTDNKDGTEQLNGAKVQPFDKLSDTIGGRNLLLGTSSAMVQNSTWNNIINVDVTHLVGTTLTYSAILDITESTQGTVSVSLAPQDSSGKSIGDSVPSNYISFRNIGKVIATITIPAGASNLKISEWTNNTNSNPLVGSRKLEKGSIATDWTPAPEDKVTDNHDGTITANNLTYDLSKSGLTPISASYSGSYNDLPLGTVFATSKMTGGPDTIHAFTTTTFYFNDWNPGRKAQIAIADSTNLMYLRVYGGVSWTSWVLLSDDSKVVHKTGDEEISGSKTFDTAPIDKATGNPYITKSDVSPLIQGVVHDGANLNNELQSGTYFSATKVTNGPGFYTAGLRDVMIIWTVTKVSSSGVTAYTQMAYNQIGNMAVRNFVSGSGWGKWTIIADDSKVVHSTDMRKPASDVAGIEEVNTKQDKIGYTPANDSKVVHSTITELNSTDMNTVMTAGFYQSINGTNGIPSGDNWTIYQVIPLFAFNGVQLAYGTNNAVLGMRSWHSLRNKGIFFNSWVQFADDSKVAHLSGANNFDTVPTVNNNPLLLASSLPSDLARTGQANTFSKQQIFSTNPTNGTQVYPIYATVGTDSDATTLIASLQSSGFSGMIGVPES